MMPLPSLHRSDDRLSCWLSASANHARVAPLNCRQLHRQIRSCVQTARLPQRAHPGFEAKRLPLSDPAVSTRAPPNPHR